MQPSIRIARLSSSTEMLRLRKPLETVPVAVQQSILSDYPKSSVFKPSETMLSERSILPSLKDCWRLSKGPLTTWVSISAFPGYLISVSWPFSLLTASSLLVGTALTSACAQTLNQMIEKDRDGLMLRTRLRPLPTGSVSLLQASTFAGICGLLGPCLLWAGTGSVASAGIAASTAAIYAGIYTPLKIRSEYNTHVGAVAGALPVLIGFASIGGMGTLMNFSSPWVLFSLQTLWQFPHFYALAWLHKDDYARGGYRMAPMGDLDGSKTAGICAPYLAALCLLPLASSSLGVTSWMFAITGTVPNLLWIKLGFLPFKRMANKQTARNFFLHSLWYLIAMYAAFVIHADEQGLVSDNDWRTALRVKMHSVCPHEWAAKDWLVPKQLCPLDKSKSLD